MRQESASYLAERLKRATRPVYIVRFRKVTLQTSSTDTAFPEDFCSGPVLNPSRPLLRYIESISGGPSQIFPEQGRASHGNLSIKFVDKRGDILRYFTFDADFEIRPGQRAAVFAGYQDIPEIEFMQIGFFQVDNRKAEPFTDPAFTVDLVDITRSLRREVFLAATPTAPFELAGHPIDIALQVMISGGGGGPYDVLAPENGLAISQDFIDIPAFEAVRAEFPNDFYCFEITAPEAAKAWLETEIFKTINAYSFPNQFGDLTLRLYRPVVP
jgi:hypothetical protein